MSYPEIEFELSAEQYNAMGCPGLKQGDVLNIVLDVGVLLPDLAADSWFTVQPEPIASQMIQVGPAHYTFSGQIQAADIIAEEGIQTATVQVQCGDIPLRAICAPQDDGLLPFGTWETRYLTGISRIQGIAEEAFITPIGHPVDVTLWGFRRLILKPGDPVFGQWHETDELAASPYEYDRVMVKARIHSRKS